MWKNNQKLQRNGKNWWRSKVSYNNSNIIEWRISHLKINSKIFIIIFCLFQIFNLDTFLWKNNLFIVISKKKMEIKKLISMKRTMNPRVNYFGKISKSWKICRILWHFDNRKIFQNSIKICSWRLNYQIVVPFALERHGHFFLRTKIISEQTYVLTYSRNFLKFNLKLSKKK